MEFLGGEDAAPQREEGFVRCEWATFADALERIKYKETRQVVRRAQAELARIAPAVAAPTEVQNGPGAA